MRMAEPKEIKTKNHPIAAWLLLALALLIILRFIPLLHSPLSTYGYDYGFYLYAISHASASWHGLTTAITGGYDNPLF